MKAAARFDVVRKEMKPQKLGAFIRRRLPIEASGVIIRGVTCRAIARSCDSPVLAALLAATRDAPDRVFHIEVLLTGFAAVASNAKSPLELSSGNSLCRLSRDPRLLDAHEMLLIGSSTVWIGDCMRRDPATCDSYECYSENCDATASAARLFFERLWRAAVCPRLPRDAGRELAQRREVASSSFPLAPEPSILIPRRH